MQEPITVLVAEDNPTDRLILSSLVRRLGHQVVTATNGQQAVQMFERTRPQLVLMDALMPVMDGFEAAPYIKQLAGDELVPIIFLTALGESEALAACLRAGGDDFLPKPYNPVALEAKILSMNRLRLLQDTVRGQRDLIARQNTQLLHEQRTAKTIFERIARSACADDPGIRCMQSPLALFSGDLLLVAYAPAGSLFVLLGDFTGHGLPAAIGAMPLAETFYGMTAEGYSSGEVLYELNAKLKRILPVEMFCCATLLDMDRRSGVLRVWNGGLPDGYLLHGDGRRVPLVSRHLPLGILPAARFDAAFETYSLQPDDRVLLLSDGVVETRNAGGEAFGEGRLQAVFEDCRDPAQVFEAIQDALLGFHGHLHDDLSLVEVCAGVSSEALSGSQELSGAAAESVGPQDWSVAYTLRNETLRDYNPLPMLLHSLLRVMEACPRADAAFSALSELYANALEHGVLRLDSSIKQDAEGFARYYALRQQRLSALREGWIRIDMDFSRQQRRGCLRIEVRDSGPGFDPVAVLAEPYAPTRLSGRGLRLVSQLGGRLWQLADAAGVGVEFVWPVDGRPDE